MARLRRGVVPVLGIPVWAGRSLPGGAVLTGLVLLGGAVPASAQTLTWSVVHSPNRRTAFNFLDGVSCVSADACTAVGHYYTRTGAPRTLIESWDGTRWSVVPSPNRGAGDNSLDGVSCVSADACTAVGYDDTRGPYRTLVESWDGTRWSVVPSPNRGSTDNNLGGVSCVSADACTAVGGSLTGIEAESPLIESWDGTRWSVVPSPSPATANNPLSSVSCASEDACMAVGFAGSSDGSGAPDRTLIESWDGARWSVLPSPNRGAGYNVLDSVSCASQDACMAGGYSASNDGVFTTLIESWDGARWSVLPSPSPGIGFTEVSVVSCVSEDACSAAGYYSTRRATKTLIESWDGSRWSVVPSPNPGTADNRLSGVSCASKTTCTAVGYYYSHGAYRTLIESGTASG